MKKIPVCVLGATGMVGQKFIELLSNHPWFEITFICASEKSQGKKYKDAMIWRMDTPLSEKIANMIIEPCVPSNLFRIAFSGLDSNVAGQIEEDFAKSGKVVISNSKNHRMDQDVPLVIPEVNGDHLELVKTQKYKNGMIVTNPNCSVIGLAMALKPLVDVFGVEKIHVVTMQAVSGAGYPGVSSFDILDNVIPFISGEEEKVETEPLKILGTLCNTTILPYKMTISAHCNRVAVVNGHMACVSVKLKKNANSFDIVQAMTSHYKDLELPSSPKVPLQYFEDERHPQPKLHRNLEKGMQVSVGRLRKCPLLDWKFALLSHNTVRGAAGCALLNAELLVKKGYIKEVLK